MVDKSQEFIRLVRVGYAARGVVYILLGYLALKSAKTASGGPQASFEFLQDLPLGFALLYVMAASLLAYAFYKLIAGLGDLERKGSDAKGIVERIGYCASSLAHATLAWSAFQFAQGEKQSAGPDSRRDAVTSLLEWEIGAIVLGLLGLSLVVAAVFQGRSAITAHFMRTVGAGAPAIVCWLGRLGFAARAIAFLVIGWSLIQAAWLGTGTHAKGLGTALVSLRESSLLYIIVSVGLLMFGLFSLIVARFRIIPDVHKKDLKTRFN